VKFLLNTEYQLIYDFDVCDEFIVISAYDKLMYYDLYSGAYIKHLDKPDFLNIQMIGMLEPNVVLSDEDRRFLQVSGNM